MSARMRKVQIQDIPHVGAVIERLAGGWTWLHRDGTTPPVDHAEVSSARCALLAYHFQAPRPAVAPGDLVDVRVIGPPEAALFATAALEALLQVTRQGGPDPSRRDPDLVRYYLSGRLRRAAMDTAALAHESTDRRSALEQVGLSLTALVEEVRRAVLARRP